MTSIKSFCPATTSSKEEINARKFDIIKYKILLYAMPLKALRKRYNFKDNNY